LASQAQADLLVSDNFGNQVLRFDDETGAFLGVFISNNPAENGGLSGAIGMRRKGGKLFVSSQFTDSILKYDLATGQFLGVFASNAGGASMAQPADLRFGPNGNLFVANFAGTSVDAFSSTGKPLGPFTSGGPGISGTSSFSFGPDGHLYVGNFGGGSIQRFDGTTGAFIDTFAIGGMSGTSGLVFDTDGSLWATSLLTNEIFHFDSTGALLDSFSTGDATFPSHILFNPNNSDELLVALTGGGGVFRFGKDGTAFGFFAGGGGLLVPGQTLFLPPSAIPEPSSWAALALASLAGVIVVVRRRRCQLVG
jgi:DNA-binding beta-propeller fold protein YncE